MSDRDFLRAMLDGTARDGSRGERLLLAEIERLRSELAAANARAGQLADALQELLDWQNGPPLNTPKYEKGWGNAMRMAEEALRSTPAAPQEPEFRDDPTTWRKPR